MKTTPNNKCPACEREEFHPGPCRPKQKPSNTAAAVKTKIYLGEKNVSVRTALRLLNDDYIDDGGYCAATVIGLRDALKESIAIGIDLRDNLEVALSELKEINSDLDSIKTPKAKNGLTLATFGRVKIITDTIRQMEEVAARQDALEARRHGVF